MFGGSYNNKKGQIKDFCLLKAGKAIPASEISKDAETTSYPCYGGNGLRGYVDHFSHDGNVCLIGRQGALCGNVTLCHGKFYATEHAIIVTIKNQNSINTIWLYYALNSMNLNQYARGVAQPGLAVKQIENLAFNVPSIDKQILFSDIYTQADKSKSSVQLALRTIKNTYKKYDTNS